MKRERWPSTLITLLGLLHAAWAPATYLIKNLDQTGSYKRPIYASQHSTTGKSVTSLKHVYPASTSYHSGGDDLTSDFIREISGIKIPYSEAPQQLPLYDKSEEDESDEHGDYGKTRAPDYNNFYSSEDYTEPDAEVTPAFRDYSDGDSSGYQEEMLAKYKVTEKIPDDNKFMPPKVKVVPIPPPCIRPEPPRPKPPPPPPPKGEWFGDATKHFLRHPPPPPFPGRYRRKPKIMYQPFIIRHVAAAPDGMNSVIIRHHTLPPIPAPPLPRRRPIDVVKEVHIHHHHSSPSPYLPVALHIHKDSLEMADNSETVEDKRLEMDIRQPYYKQTTSSTGFSSSTASGQFAEPPSFQNF